MIESLLLVFLVCCAVSYLSCWGIRCWGPRWGLLDKPGLRKIHDIPMPTAGGIGVWLSVVVPLGMGMGFLYLLSGKEPFLAEGFSFLGSSMVEMTSLLKEHSSGILSRSGRLAELLALGTVLLILGTIDDRWGLSWKIRIFVQLLVATIAVARGWKATFFLEIPWLTAILSVLWITALVNSFNMLDNMDGLSAGVAGICTIFLAAVSFIFAKNPLSCEPQLFVGGFLIVLLGAIVGFLLHNRPPARLFMGDGGAYFIGFLLATITISATFVGPTAPQQAIFVPLCIFAVPLYDLCSVVWIRLKHGLSPFHGDKNHYSHRLVELGLSRSGAVLTIYLTTAICGISSLFLYQVTWTFACLVLGQVLMILGLIATLEYAARQQRKKP